MVPPSNSLMRRAWGRLVEHQTKSLFLGSRRFERSSPKRAIGIERNRATVIWFEVEDFLRYFDHFRNPTGLQRVPFEIYFEANRLYGVHGRVRFCRLSLYTKQIRTTNFGVILAAFLKSAWCQRPMAEIMGAGEARTGIVQHARDNRPQPAIFLFTIENRCS